MEVLETFAARHGRLPCSWDELSKDGLANTPKGDTVAILRNGRTWILEKENWKVAWGASVHHANVLRSGVVVHEDGSRSYLLETRNIPWPLQDFEDVWDVGSRRIAEAMAEGNGKAMTVTGERVNAREKGGDRKE